MNKKSLVWALVVGVAVGGGVMAASNSTQAAAGGLPGAKIVDLHCHTAGIGAGGSGCRVSDRLRSSYKFRAYLRSFGVSLAELERQGDGLVVDRIANQVAQSRHVAAAVILALDGPVTADGELDVEHLEVYVPNEFVAEQVSRHPELRFGASVNPWRPDALERLEWAKAHGAVLVKWLPSVQRIDPADPRLVPFYRKLVELGLPLLTHTGSEHAFTGAEDAYCDPERLRLPLREGVVVIAAHAGTTGRYEGEPSLARLCRLMDEFPNLFADVSSLTQLNKRTHLQRVLAEPAMRNRLVYGTDYPLVSMRSLVSPWYYPRLGWTMCRRISRIANPWDRDVELKASLGMPSEVWTRGERLLARDSRR